MPLSNENGELIGPPPDPSISGAFTAAQLMADCSEDGVPSLTANHLSHLKQFVPDKVWIRPDWAWLLLHGGQLLGILSESTKSFLQAAESWHQAQMGFAVSMSWGRSPDTARKLAGLLRNADEQSVRRLVRQSPDDHLRELERSVAGMSDVLAVVEAEWKRRSKQVGRSGVFRRVRTPDEWERSQAGRMFHCWLRAGYGAPALCFWSWDALDSLLMPVGKGGGAGSKTLARRLGLKKALDQVRGCRVTESAIVLKVRQSATATGEAAWMWRNYPKGSYG